MPNDSIVGHGQIWVKDGMTLMFTDDEDNDFTVDVTPV